MILLIGDAEDPHLQELCTEVKLRRQCKILSTEHSDLLETQFSFYTNTSGIYSCSITQRKNTIEINEVELAFCLSPVFRSDRISQLQESKFWYFSWKEALYGFYHLLSIDSKFVNKSIENCLACQSKISVFFYAQRVGLKIPKTLISNSEDSIDNFFSKNERVVLKTLHQMSLNFEEEPTMLLVQEVSNSDFSEYKQQNESPLFLQIYINKLYDIRLIVIGTLVVACKIDASSSQFGCVDYRAYDLPNTPHYQVEIPVEVENKILQLCTIMNLEYACIDLCVDTNNEYWLLDVNPFGRYLWIEYATGLPITRHFSDFLCCGRQA